MEMSHIKKVGIVAFVCAALCGVFGYYYTHEVGPMCEFNPARDTAAILKLFDQEWHWLIANEGSSPAFYLKYRTPNENPAYFGKLKIKVLREHNELIGFVAYYMERPGDGRLLFLAVDKNFRGKGYGTILAEYAMQDMVNNCGAQKIGLWTRLSNPAQRIYKKLGFVESYYTEGGYIYFEYYP